MKLPDIAKVVTPSGVVTGTVAVDGDRITEVTDREGEEEGWIIPGFVDIHCHGGNGASYTVGEAEQARKAAQFHLRHGTTSTLASLVSSPFELMMAATKAFAPLADEGVIAGIHFEGPYLSGDRCGAQNPKHLRDPDIQELSALLEVGGDAVRMMTIAPERDGAIEAIRWMADNGVVASLGHTDASYEATVAGVDAGATAATHVFNGMRPFNHRDPGPIPVVLDDVRVTCEFIADPTHLHMGSLRFALHASMPQWTVLVTDAVDAAGMPDGDYELGGLRVRVSDGAARLKSDGSLAGSTITMIDAFRNTVKLAGIDVPSASQMASRTPAELIGLSDVGVIEAGRRADLLVLSDELELQGVMRAGQWVE